MCSFVGVNAGPAGRPGRFKLMFFGEKNESLDLNPMSVISIIALYCKLNNSSEARFTTGKKVGKELKKTLLDPNKS